MGRPWFKCIILPPNQTQGMYEGFDVLNYLETDIVGYEISYKGSKREASENASTPFNKRVLKSSPLYYNVFFLRVRCNCLFWIKPNITKR